MSEVLSQNEIDELLRALASGVDEAPEAAELSDDNIRNYDFKAADKFSKEQMRTFHVVFDSFAQLASTYLAGVLRCVCSCEVVSIQELRFVDFTNSLPEPIFLGVLDMTPMEVSGLMTISPNLGYAIISHVFGGGDELGNTDKDFTQIEVTTLTRIARQLVARMRESWSRVLDIALSLDRVETNSQLAQIVSLSEATAIITLNFQIGRISDLVNICIPYTAIEPVAQQLSTKLWYSSSYMKEVVPQTETIRERIMRTNVALCAQFQETTATVSDVMSLQIGDVIQLSHSVKDPITIMVEHLPKFIGYIGTMGNRYAVRVDEIIKEVLEDE